MCPAPRDFLLTRRGKRRDRPGKVLRPMGIEPMTSRLAYLAHAEVPDTLATRPPGRRERPALSRTTPERGWPRPPPARIGRLARRASDFGRATVWLSLYTAPMFPNTDRSNVNAPILPTTIVSSAACCTCMNDFLTCDQ